MRQKLEPKISSRETLLLALVVVLGAALRFSAISRNSLWLDEMTSLQIASQPFADILSGKGFDRHTPPFYYLLLHSWLVLAPFTEAGLRSLSAVLDTLNIVLVYKIFSFQFNRSAGLLTAALFATSAYAVYFAQEGRMYPLLLFFTLVSYQAVLRLLDDPQQRAASLSLLISGVLGLYTHYYYALFLAGLSLVLLFKSRKGRLGWILPLFIAGSCFLPWLKVIAELSQSAGQTFRGSLYPVLPYTFFRFVSGYAVLPLNFQDKLDFRGTIFANIKPILIYFIPFGIMLAYGARVLFRRYSSQAALVSISLIFSPLIAVLISLKVPMLSERYLITIFPLVLVLLALALLQIQNRCLKTSAFTLCSILWLFALVQTFTNPKFGFTQWKDAAALIASQDISATVVLVNPHYTSGLIDFYLDSRYQILPVPDKAPERVTLPNAFWLVERGTAESIVSYVEKLGLRRQKEYLLPLENGVRIYYFSSSLGQDSVN